MDHDTEHILNTVDGAGHVVMTKGVRGNRMTRRKPMFKDGLPLYASTCSPVRIESG